MKHTSAFVSHASPSYLAGLAKISAAVAFVLVAGTHQVIAAPVPAPIKATTSTQIGDTVTNPVTGVNSKVVQLIKDPNGVTDYVLTDSGAIILTKTTVGNTIQPINETAVYTVVTVTNNATTGLPQTTTIRLSTLPTTDPTTSQAVLVSDDPVNYANFLAAAGSSGAGAVTPPTSTSGIINEVSVGAGGSNGSNAYGIKIPLIGTIGKSGSAGGNGADGPTVNRPIYVSHGAITSTAPNTPGIMIGSVGGDGGKGGDSYGNITAYAGGTAGNGGSVTVNNATSVSTAGDKSHGIFVFSRSGTGGAGGKGYIFASGGTGGAARDGGDVALTNSGAVQTSGAESHGLYALSVGGAAGSGGSSWGIVGEGGSGSNGGNGGDVSVTNSGDIQTTGTASHGILAQSIGGTGGNGGAAGGIVAFGGSASNGGTGGNVTITNQTGASITTTGKGSIGVFGQSIGGSGGDSGAAGGIVGLGASGGTGNNAGTVTITNETGTSISTTGQDAHGVFGQSVGGGGGNTAPTGGVVAIGGSASGGGNGNTVTINSSAVISTLGKNSHGLFAQSIGGGGGSAGGAGGLVSLGASGGAGGNGGIISISNFGVIHTKGVGSHAIFGQSIGGGGGAGGDAGGAVAIGGSSSSGGTGGTVTITNSAGLLTDEKDSRGIFAQSIGGGGGSGGGSGGIVALGGSGSAGSNAAAVSVTNASGAAIFTKGAGSDAIFAQSIGGGGGAGAGSGGLVGLGGSGTGGGAGGTVTVTNGGILSTKGDVARGIFAQSLGGGGGSGGTGSGLLAIGGSGSNTSNAAAVTVTNTGNIETAGNRSTAIFAQSVGGGGGDGGSSSGVFAIGGSGGSGGAAGDVTVTHSGEITTIGNDAFGIFAQAVGGGGGNGGSAYSGGFSAGLALGGSGSSGGDGKQATVNLNNISGTVRSSISTAGDRSTGILAQSVGGGGGNGGNSVQSTVGAGVSLSVAIGGTAGTGGAGGIVNLTGTGDVTTTGANASGIILQSVGGGGGNGGTTVSTSTSIGDGLALGVAIGGAGGAGGAGGVVTGTSVNSIIDTDGAFSTGFLAQSVGGGGGNGGTTFAASAAVGALGGAGVSVAVGGSGATGGTGGSVNITLGGKVTTRDVQSDGIVIQSVGGGGGNGGLTIAAAAAGGALGAGNLTVGLGGSAGNGNIGSRVDATITSDVETQKDGSEGVVIQSIGGGGGNSGLTVSAGASASAVGAGGVNIGIGGSSGTGGHGGIVDASYSGVLKTFGDNSTGLLVQSVGGGGGNSSGTIAASLNGAGVGAGSAAISIGGSGGAAGNGGSSDPTVVRSVLLTTTGSVSTSGKNSSGIVVQSIGGGGGNGGYTVAGALSGAGVGSGAVSVGVGGGAGTGGDGKGVYVRLGSTITTDGEDSTGALIQSVGGGGGNGGFNISGSGSGAGIGSGGIAVGLGGKGGSGGLGGNIDAGSTGAILTLQDRSSGLVVQSIGGGGGNGGFNVSGSASGAGVGSGAISVGLGGNGGSGNHAGSITLTTSNNVETHGKHSSGIVVQSLGGGGGNGGFNIAASLSGGGVGSGAISVGLGGTGAAGGDGKTVYARLASKVLTRGEDSTGVLFQSIGGGGGNGGFNVSGALSGAGVGGGGIAVGLGGKGGSGGTGGDVDGGSTGTITTIEDRSSGLVAQSIGGGGGNGGFNISGAGSGAGVGSGAISVGLGGEGGIGNDAGNVTVATSGDIVTLGNQSSGIIGQSLGGGGGNGGFNISATASGAGVGSGAISVGLGGSGGAGGEGKAVTLTINNDVITLGSQSNAVTAQSIGGGGGNGGYNVSGSASAAGVGSGAISVGLGGSGAGGGKAGAVTVTVTGKLDTTLDDSAGILAQSIGGGGGNGGFNISGSASGAGVGSGGISVGVGGSGALGGTGGDVTVTSTDTITTRGDRSFGLLAQSIGGGGGNGGYNVSAAASGGGIGSGAIAIGLGGTAGAGNNAGLVTVSTSKNVATLGVLSSGIVAQSIGGGGGNGGFNVSGSLSGAGVGSGAISVGLGGSGGAGGAGGEVRVTVANNVFTGDDQSNGVVAQSIGGGGGNGGFNGAGSGSGAGVGSGAINVGIGGAGAGGGTGGKVTGSVTGNVETQGHQSRGILAQSIGGGGGNGGLNVTASVSGAGVGSGGIGMGLGGASAAGGNSGQVTLTTIGDVLTLGEKSQGVVAQSIGGGGGNAAMTIALAGSGGGTGSGAVGVSVGGSGGGGGQSGRVDASVTGDISTVGDFSDGYVVQSIGGGGGNGALTIAGTGSGAGVGSGAVSVSVGGTGGTGGDSNIITAAYSGNLITLGNNSIGMLVQAIGGGGGNGGAVVAAGGSGAGTGSGAVSVAIGGNGGAAGVGGLSTEEQAVTATASGMIATEGNFSGGIVAQSIGGGGGNGGYTISANGSGAGTGSGAVALGLGGGGAGGGAGKGVLTNSSADILTFGDDSIGMLTQSIGGGGGNGGFNVSAVGSAAGTGSGGVAIGLGGNGGGGGNAGFVNATSSGSIYTKKNRSSGFVAQSIGGGGGNGGFNVSAAISGAGTGSGTVSVGMGGSGAGGGNGGSVIAATLGEIFTEGKSSHGILAQSIGGGGGNGGFNVTASGSGAGTGSGAVAVGLGGTGAGGGNGSTVKLTVANDVTTLGNNSSGIIAQSVGGGGGSGGFDVTVAGSGGGTGSGAVSVSLGGNAGTGGTGAKVESTVVGNVVTAGNNSSGLLIQSLGGGGGNGGFSVSAAISGAGTGSGTLAVGIGGTGGDGGSSGEVISSHTGNVTTGGVDAAGLIAQSIGGGGGNGGLTVAGSVSAAGTGSGSVSVGLGGSGGGGGSSDIVTNTVIGNISTAKSGSGGVLAQSLGGGGGNGAINVSGAISLAGTGSGAVAIGLGGSGGLGGNSKKVTNSVTGIVQTIGNESGGIAAQSIGGGGGNGGMNITGAIAAAKTGAGSIGIGIGGAGGGGGDAGEVVNTVKGYVQTEGDNSNGILAQSLGGGGGNGGMNITGTFSAAKTGSGTLAIGVGGFGGDGGQAFAVTNTVTGGIVTTGDNSNGSVAQSLGGGGGNGALNVSGAINLSKENGGAVAIGIGGFGGGGGHASSVTSTIKTTSAHNLLGTTGKNSSAAVAQSIGGGGGNGGMNITGVVNITGKNGAAVGVGVGGFGGDAGNAGKVILDVSGNIITEGDNSNGLLAQSIGGGGGNGGTNITGSLAITTSSGGAGKTLAASIGIGGFGGSGGDAGDVEVKYQGFLRAQPLTLIPAYVDPDSGDTIPAESVIDENGGSHGIAAQSIGGGGGNGGINVSAGISYARGDGDGYGLMVGFGGFGGGGGDAGNVNVDVVGNGLVSAYGAGRSAIFAQSVGGGGGNGGLNVSGGIVSDSPLIVGVGGFGGDAGVAKNVVVNAATDVIAGAAYSKDLNAAGILAQSIGGGGGNGGLNVSGGVSLGKEKSVPSITVGIGGFGGKGSISGDVTVNHTGNATTSGNWIHGIMAQSIAGGGGNGAMNVTGQFNWADSDNSGGKTDLTVVAGIGGNGGKGANAGNVLITHDGVVSTSGDHARGVAAQSIGGGGGTGGMNITGVFAKNSSPISVGVGGSGSGGGHAGTVTVNRGTATQSTGQINTNGDAAHGIEASSIGGGGGDAGMNFNAGLSLAGKGETESGFAANIAIGGAGGEAGNGSTATVNNYSDIITQRVNSHGIIAQSIGGGGGNANLNISLLWANAKAGDKTNKNAAFSLAVGGAPGDGGDGGEVNVVQKGNIETLKANSYGVLAQSIGGGGGNASLDVAMAIVSGPTASITLGRVGGSGGIGSDVSLSLDGSVLTRGDGSFGLLAQSIGNGGGNSSATTVGITDQDTDDKPQQAASVSIGLEGGTGGTAGDVTLTAQGFVTTEGKNAHAIFAQSVGGGGGNGGTGNTFGLSAATAALSLGGAGGTGGTGGIVTLTSSAQVRTKGDSSVGILAQSIGGGGGTGGMARSGGAKSKVDGITISVGGAGGAGMTSDKVTVVNSGIIITEGLGSHGVLAQSLGGGGGNAGMTINSIVKNADKDPSNRVAISIGGTGGTGAVSGDVSVTNTGGIGTTKASSVGIFAQSIGGGGGNADYVTTALSAGDGGGNDISVGIGGKGGTGAAAGNVSVFNNKGTTDSSGQIITLANYSHGILAMSVGGGGGTGSNTITTHKKGKEGTSTSANSFNMSIGGFGGIGGTGGTVEVGNEGKITTYGYAAHGIIAQSIGGGGGNGGLAMTGDTAIGAKAGDTSTSKAGSFALGGFGGDGNKAGNVTVTNSGIIEVFGNKSYGIYAQSVGGGGGDGGFASTISKNLKTNPKTDLKKSLMNLGVGGNGGDGGDSGNVVVNHTGSITSHGDDSYGIFAQSVGGGGGNVGYSLTSPTWMAADLAISTVLGGRDGSKGTAGTVTINTTGDIIMLGKNSTAQLAQSINGGGGNVNLFLDFSQQAVELGDDGFELPDNSGSFQKIVAFVQSGIKLGSDLVSDAVGSLIKATHVGDLFTQAKNSIASLTQSIGGGGGSAQSEVIVDSIAKVDLTLALGGTTASNNSGGDLNLTRTGDVATTGAQSSGINVQSIGGGGGNFNVNVEKVPTNTPAAAAAPLAAPAVNPLAQNAPLPAPPAPGVTSSAQLGGDNVSNSNGGNINLAYSGNVSTASDRSFGIIVQSIGGGGGKLDLTGSDKLNIAIGGINGASGNGGNIDLSNSGIILTQGVLAHAIILQSIGGGGGAAFTDLQPGDITVTRNPTNSGNGGNIRLAQSDDVVVTGNRSIGIVAQSLGGGGGIVDRVFAGTAGGVGTSGAITIDLTGNVKTLGRRNIGVFAQSLGSGAQGNIRITLAEDNMIFSGINGVGVEFSGGNRNTFLNRGTVIGTDGLLAWSVMGGAGGETIYNEGLFSGQVNLRGGANRFVNRVGGILVPGPRFLLGNSVNLLINEGALRPGDMLNAQRTGITGGFVQGDSGVTYTELDFGSNRIDQFYMTGRAQLGGTLELSLLNPQLAPSGHSRKILFSADRGVVNAGIELITAPSVVIDYELLYPNSTTAVLDYNVDFAVNSRGEKLGINLREVGFYLNRIQNAGSSDALADTIIKLLYDPTLDAYKESLSMLSPDFYAEHQAEAIRSAQRFEQTMAEGGIYRYVAKDKMLWFNYDYVDTLHSSYDDYKTVRQHADNFSIGLDHIIEKDWTLGMALSLSENRASGYEGRWTSEGNSQYAGAILKRRFGKTELTGTLSYGWNEINSRRTGQVTTAYTTNIDRRLETLESMLRASHEFAKNGFYLKPILDLGVTYLMVEGAEETGAGATSLVLGDYSETHFWVRPALRFGNTARLGAGLKLNTHIEVGYQKYLGEEHTDVVATFSGAPDGVAPMQVPVELGSLLQVSAGIQIVAPNDMSLGVEYSKTIDKHYDLDRVSLKVNIPF